MTAFFGPRSTADIKWSLNVQRGGSLRTLGNPLVEDPVSSKYIKTNTRTRKKTVTSRDVQKALRKASLSREEELVLRMRLGVTESLSTPLEFRGNSSDELATKLAMMEREALGKMRPRPVSQTPPEGQALKNLIVEELKRI